MRLRQSSAGYSARRSQLPVSAATPFIPLIYAAHPKPENLAPPSPRWGDGWGEVSSFPRARRRRLDQAVVVPFPEDPFVAGARWLVLPNDFAGTVEFEQAIWTFAILKEHKAMMNTGISTNTRQRQKDRQDEGCHGFKGSHGIHRGGCEGTSREIWTGLGMIQGLKVESPPSITNAHCGMPLPSLRHRWITRR